MTNRSVRVVLVRPRNPLNIGACARAMANFGRTELVVVEPYEPVWQETRSAPEAEDVVLKATAAASWEDAVAGSDLVIGTSSFHQRGKEQAIIELPNLNRYLASFPASEKLTLVFGSERSGLSNEELSRCRVIVRIPTQQGSPSMNLSHAVAVVLYEMRRVGWEKSESPVAATPGELETMITAAAALGEAIDYPAGSSPSVRVGRIRQALQGTVWTPAAVRFLLSFFRRLRRKSPVS